MQAERPAAEGASDADASVEAAATRRPAGRARVPGVGHQPGGDAGAPAALRGEPIRPIEITSEVWASLETPATITNSFRYTDEELSALADALYEISKQQNARLTKQDVARLGLNVVLDDYRRRGPASLLGQLAGRRRPRRVRGG